MNPFSLCDTHFHITKDDDLESILNHAKEKNVLNLILSCCSLEDIEYGLEVSKRYPNIYLTIGLHPDEIKDYNDNLINYLENLIINNEKIIGIGEIGLDYFHNKENIDKQKELFISQLELAKKLNLPVVIHSRDAFLDTYNILKDYDLKVTIHCFTGSLEVANMYIKNGYLLGIGGVLTFKNSKLKEVLKDIPINNIVFETDSPYMAPVPFRGEKNEPRNVSIICDYLCNIKNINKEEMIKITTNNVINQYSRIKR